MTKTKALLGRFKHAQAALSDATQRIRRMEREIAFAVCPDAIHIHVDGEHAYDDHGGVTFYVSEAVVEFSNGTRVFLPREEDLGFWDADKLLAYPDKDSLLDRLEKADDEEQEYRSIFAQKLGIPRANSDALLEVIWSICSRVRTPTTTPVRPTRAEQEETIMDTMVGVVISTRYGCPFGDTIPQGIAEARVRMDPALVAAVREDNLAGIETACGRFGIQPERLRRLTLGVHFVPSGTKFIVQDRDGKESVVLLSSLPVMEAA